MIKVEDLHEAIAECEGTRNPNSSTCIKLAAYYTILQHLEGDIMPTEVATGYSNSSGIQIGVDNEFLNELDGKSPQAVWALIAEFVETIYVVEPKLYRAMMRKAKEIS